MILKTPNDCIINYIWDELINKWMAGSLWKLQRLKKLHQEFIYTSYLGASVRSTKISKKNVGGPFFGCVFFGPRSKRAQLLWHCNSCQWLNEWWHVSAVDRSTNHQKPTHTVSSVHSSRHKMLSRSDSFDSGESRKRAGISKNPSAWAAESPLGCDGNWTCRISSRRSTTNA